MLSKKEIDAHYGCNQDEANCIFRCKKKRELLFEWYMNIVSFWLVQVNIDTLRLPYNPVYRREEHIYTMGFSEHNHADIVPPSIACYFVSYIASTVTHLSLIHI